MFKFDNCVKKIVLMYLKIVTTAATIAIGRTFYVANNVTND